MCVPSLPVTFVPMLSLRGISSGRSLQFDTSEIFPCCSSRIFCLFCRRAVRSSTKNAEEHLDGIKTQHHLHCLNSEFPHTAPKLFNNTAYRRGFPISLLIVPHSTLVNFLVFRLGNDSLRHKQNSLSPSKRGLESKKRDAFSMFTRCWITSVIRRYLNTVFWDSTCQCLNRTIHRCTICELWVA